MADLFVDTASRIVEIRQKVARLGHPRTLRGWCREVFDQVVGARHDELLSLLNETEFVQNGKSTTIFSMTPAHSTFHITLANPPTKY